MSISLDQTPDAPDRGQASMRAGRAFASRWLAFAYWGAVALMLIAAVLMRLYHLDLAFDRDGYDEGVYWQSLRAMFDGGHLYSGIFYSQPPLFLLSTYPGFALFGASLWSARFGIVLVSLLGFLGAYLLGKTLAGRLGALAALLLLLLDPLYLAQSQTIQAEASSVAFTLLAIAFAFMWWQHPDGRRGICWAVLCGVTFAASLLCKLLCISTIVPIGCLMLARAWQIYQRKAGTNRGSWLPLLLGILAALLTIVIMLLPYLGALKDLWAGVVTFHSAASHDVAMPLSANVKKIATGLVPFTAIVGLYGMVVAVLRRDWRVLPLVAWLLATFVALLFQQPLFIHHLIALEPPFIALALLGLPNQAAFQAVQNTPQGRSARLSGTQASNVPTQAPAARQAVTGRLMGRLVAGVTLLAILVACVGGLVQDIKNYQYADTCPFIQPNLSIAADLRQAIAPGQWVVTDAQFIAALADRSTPPELVDTSNVRIKTGYITLAQLEQESLNPRVHAVLFYTGRFSTMSQATDFHAWVAARFHLLRTYGPSQELWVR